MVTRYQTTNFDQHATVDDGLHYVTGVSLQMDKYQNAIKHFRFLVIQYSTDI